MKKIFFAILLALSAVTANAQMSNSTVYTPVSTDNPKYRLFQTSNIYTFLKLDTATGKIWQVQWSMEENEFSVTLNAVSLLPTGETEKPGRFFLYPTQNIYTFLLIDQKDGRVWHVQWSQDANNRGIIKIPTL